MSKIKSITYTLNKRILSIYPDSRDGRTYKQQINQYAKWLTHNHKKRMTLEESSEFVTEYMQHLRVKGKADATLNTAVSALCKIYKNLDSKEINRKIIVSDE